MLSTKGACFLIVLCILGIVGLTSRMGAARADVISAQQTVIETVTIEKR